MHLTCYISSYPSVADDHSAIIKGNPFDRTNLKTCIVNSGVYRMFDTQTDFHSHWWPNSQFQQLTVATIFVSSPIEMHHLSTSQFSTNVHQGTTFYQPTAASFFIIVLVLLNLAAFTAIHSLHIKQPLVSIWVAFFMAKWQIVNWIAPFDAKYPMVDRVNCSVVYNVPTNIPSTAVPFSCFGVPPQHSSAKWRPFFLHFALNILLSPVPFPQGSLPTLIP